MSDDRFHESLREDLKVKVTAVFASPGTILVVHPKREDVQFNPEYANWLAKTLGDLLPDGVKGMVISDYFTGFTVEEPKKLTDDTLSPRELEMYHKGWSEALNMVARKYTT